MTFEECRQQGGRVTTERVGDKRYRAVCTLGSKVYFDALKTKKSKRRR